MKATLIKNLFRRLQPTNEVDAQGSLDKGSVIEIAETVRGKMIDGEDKWYKAKDGFYYWGGGVEILQVSVVAQTDYNLLLNPPADWNILSGRDINIAIIDTGCFMHNAIKDAVVAKYNAIEDNTDVNDMSLSGHGTFISGIIAAKNDSQVGGIAKNVKLIIVKVANDDDTIEAENVFKGLNWLAETCNIKPHIINISLQFFPGNVSEKINSLFKTFKDKGTLIFSGAQNDGELSNGLFYPAKHDEIIAVGALSVNSSAVQLNKKVEYIVPNINYNSLNNSFFNPYTNNKGCSFASASLSGYAALALSYFVSNNLNGSFSDFFNQSINSFNPQSFSDKYKIYKNI